MNLGSPKQLQVVLFEELGLPKTKKIKTGYTTDADALQELYVKTEHPFLGYLLRHRDVVTAQDRDRRPAPDDRRRRPHPHHLQPDDRLDRPAVLHRPQPAEHSDPHGGGAADPAGVRVGEGFECLLTADYSQIEMRIMAHLSEDPALIEAFQSG